MRELLDKHILRYLIWVDTRDMYSDGLTKGAVARDAIHELMAGLMVLRHKVEQWCCKLRPAPDGGGPLSDAAPSGGHAPEAWSKERSSGGHAPEARGKEPPSSGGKVHLHFVQPTLDTMTCFYSSYLQPSSQSTPRVNSYRAAILSSTVHSMAAAQSSTTGGGVTLVLGDDLEYNRRTIYVDPKDGKTYRYGSGTGVNDKLSLDDVQDYVKRIGQLDTVQFHDPKSDVPYNSISDYVSTLRNVCAPDGPFQWPSENLRFNKGVTVALHHCPPGHAVCLQNGRSIPERMLKHSYKSVRPAGGEHALDPSG